MQLTAMDKNILQSYKSVIEGLANYLGTSYEFVLHSLEDYDTSVISIINGYHTGRSVGAPITDLALDMLQQINNHQSGEDYCAYFASNSKKEPLKSTTIAIRGENNRIIGLLCINFYLNTPYIDILKNMGVSSVLDSKTENFVSRVDRDISQTINSIKNAVNSNPTIPDSQKNKAIISLLDQQNIFNIKDAVISVAEALNISKNTVYLHLRNLKQ